MKMKRFKPWPWFVQELLAPRISRSFQYNTTLLHRQQTTLLTYIHACIIWYKLLVFGQKIIYHGVSSLFDINMRITVPHKRPATTHKKVNLKNIENETNFGSMTKTRDKLFFFLLKPHSSFISSLFLWPVLSSPIVGLGTSRK